MKIFAGKALNGAAVLAVGQTAGYGLSFVRNLVLARTLTKADFGLASAFALSVALLELAGRMALGQQVVRSHDPDLKKLLGNMQTVQFLAGMISGTLLFCLSGVLARFLAVPQHAWAFSLLAVIPVCMALENLGVYRFNQELRFGPGVLCEIVPQLVVTAAAWPLVLWLRDFRVILWLMIGKCLLAVALTQFLSNDRYRLAWDPDVLRKIMAFSWPLFLSALFVFASQQADQLLVGAKYSLQQLALYSVPFSILMVPWVFFARVMGPLMLSVFSKVQSNPEEFRKAYRLWFEVSAVATVLLTAPLIVCGEQVAMVLFGRQYSDAGGIMAILAVATAFRFLRSTPNVAALALGDSQNQLFGVIARTLSLPLAILVVLVHGGLEVIAVCAVVGEISAFLISVRMTLVRQSLPLHLVIGPVAFSVGCLSVSAIVFGLGSHRWPAIIAFSVAGVFALLFAAIGLWVFPQTRALVRKEWVRRPHLAQAF